MLVHKGCSRFGKFYLKLEIFIDHSAKEHGAYRSLHFGKARTLYLPKKTTSNIFIQTLAGSAHRREITDLLAAENEVLIASKGKAEAMNAFVIEQTRLDRSTATPDVSSLPISEDKFTYISATAAASTF